MGAGGWWWTVAGVLWICVSVGIAGTFTGPWVVSVLGNFLPFAVLASAAAGAGMLFAGLGGPGALCFVAAISGGFAVWGPFLQPGFQQAQARQASSGRSAGEGERIRVLQGNAQDKAQSIGFEGYGAAILSEVFSEASWKAAKGSFPHSTPVGRVDGGFMETAVFSRHPIEGWGHFGFNGSWSPGVWADIRLPSGALLRVVGIHPHSPQTPARLAGRDSFLLELSGLTREWARQGMDFLVAGDFNVTPWSARIGGLEPEGAPLSPGFWKPTWPAVSSRAGIGFPIDLIGASEGVLVEKRRVVDAGGGSDHLFVENDVVVLGARKGFP